ncbi:MAG: PD-(D/E)XK nuclease family protein [Candidatus Sumerlaeia bacterium]|nr:PD-(D/E)XK nuclease family protein [Candidatus Sumerlaeia bacterium]
MSAPPRLVVGRAGSGRTAWCVERIASECRAAAEGAPLLLLTPEQATYEAERALAGATGGYVRAQVLSFTRLAGFLEREAPPPALPRLDAAQRTMLAARVVQRLRAADPGAELFAVRGIEEPLARFLSDAHRHRLTSARLRAAAAASPAPRFAQRMERLAAFLDAYDELIRDRFEDPDATLESLEQGVRRSELLQGAEVLIDGFNGFTPQEERLLGALASRARAFALTLAVDPARAKFVHAGELAPVDPVFSPTEETLQRLRAVFDREGLPPVEWVRLGAPRAARFAAAPGLAAIEERFLQGAAPADGAAAGGVVLAEAASRRAEARFAAELCRRWIAEEGVEPASCAVLARSLDDYAGELAAQLTALRVPHFIDRVQPLAAHSLQQGLGAALTVLSGRWQWEEVCEFARCGFVEMSRRDADLLADACARNPPTAKGWRDERPWAAPPDRSFEDDPAPRAADGARMAAVDRLRRIAAEPLLIAEQELREAAEEPASATVAALLSVLRRLAAQWWELLPEESRTSAELAVAERLSALFDACGDALGAVPTPAPEAVEHARWLLGQLSVPRIPPRLGQVLVTQLDRGRTPPLERAVLVGWSAAQFPARLRTRSVLGDDDREELARLGLDAPQSARGQFAREAFLAYFGLTRASGEIAVTRPLRSDSGEELPPSPYWTALRRLLPDTEPVRVAEPGPAEAARERELAALAAVRSPRALLAERAAALFAPPSEESAAVLRAALRTRPSRVDPALLRALHHAAWDTSATALESFARCPFQHFAARVLRPEEPLAPEGESRDAGTLAHAFLKELADALIARGASWGGMPEEEWRALGAELRTRFEERAQRTGLFSGAVGSVFLEAVMGELEDLLLWMRAAHALAPARPVAAEAPFADDPIRVESGAGPWEVRLRGRIDRVDACGADGRLLAVVDYKLTKASFSLARWHHDLALQLPLYLLALDAARLDGEPAAALNVVVARGAQEKRSLLAGDFGRIKMAGPASDSYAAPFREGSARKGNLPFLSSSGVLGDAAFGELLRLTEKKVRALLERMMSGELEPRPVLEGDTLACAQCGFQALCGFDPLEDEPRELARVRAADVRAELEAAP